jgi:hypothetical protein
MNGAKSASATFTANSYGFSVTKAGAEGTGGTITSVPTGIDCGSDCNHVYEHGQQVVLTAARNSISDQTAVGWTGCDSSTATTCTVTVNGAETVQATFTLNSYLLTVDAENGSVKSEAPHSGDIDCSSDCAHTYTYNTKVTLTATEPSDLSSRFDGWSANCAPVGSDPMKCEVTMDQARNVTATFIRRFDVNVRVDGDGSLTGDVPCTSATTPCEERFDRGETISLTAEAAPGSTLSGWSNCPNPSGNQCTISNIVDHHIITAHFLPTAP